MVRTTVWIDGTLTRSGQLLDLLSERLTASGIVVLPTPGDPAAAAGLLVLDAVSSHALERLRVVTDRGRRRVLVLVTARSGLNDGDGWRLLEHGAADVLVWQPRLEGQLRDRLDRWAALAELVQSDTVRSELVGSSPSWIRALHRLVEAARFSTSALLITGESGTGKELAARLAHHLDPRVVRGRLVVVDCTTVVPALSGSEFFGHERGSFTGAHAVREGAFAAADGGTLFLDEVGELPLPLQAELLRVVQEGTYKRVGGNDWRHTSFRLVCATNRDLAREVSEGGFRADLYYRIAVATVALPPLRERTADILPLFHHFVRAARGEDLDVAPEVADLLQRRTYPGNVRDLRQLSLRVLARHVGSGTITVGDVPEEERPRLGEPGELRGDGGPPEREAASDSWAESDLDALIRSALDCGARYDDIRTAVTTSARRVALQRAGGSQKRAAEMLGLTPRALQKQRHRAASPAGREDRS